MKLRISLLERKQTVCNGDLYVSAFIQTNRLHIHQIPYLLTTHVLKLFFKAVNDWNEVLQIYICKMKKRKLNNHCLTIIYIIYTHGLLPSDLLFLSQRFGRCALRPTPGLSCEPTR